MFKAEVCALNTARLAKAAVTRDAITMLYEEEFAGVMAPTRLPRNGIYALFQYVTTEERREECATDMEQRVKCAVRRDAPTAQKEEEFAGNTEQLVTPAVMRDVPT